MYVAESEIEEWAREAMPDGDTTYAPRKGDIMCFYTQQGVYGPVEYQDNATCWTFSVREPLLGSARLDCYNATTSCIDTAIGRINKARAAVAQASHQMTHFSYFQIFNIIGAIKGNAVVLTIDVSIACPAKTMGNMLDAML